METGTIIPDILGTDQDGNIIRRSDYPGRSIALYFYPKDSTSGCTAQACNLRDNYQSLLDAGYQVIGVSVDSADSHKKFIAKNSLPFPLITDTDHKLVTEFGVWGEKSMYGRIPHHIHYLSLGRSDPHNHPQAGQDQRPCRPDTRRLSGRHT